MSDNGYVYVLMNSSMRGLVKIGKTEREPEERAKELSASTGVPTPFMVVYDSYFESCSEAEVFVHTLLADKGFRVSSNREFFEIPIKDAIDAVVKAKEHFGKFEKFNKNQYLDEEGIFSSGIENDFLDDLNYQEKAIEPWEEAFETAETHYYGFGDEIQDYEEAMTYYLKAIKLGSIDAYIEIGRMYVNGEGVKENSNKAFQYFKEGAKKGNIECYAEIAQLFGRQDNIENALKSWKKYFKLSTAINYSSISSYISFLRTNDLELQYINKLIPFKEGIISHILNSIDMMKGTENEQYIVPYLKKNIEYVKLNLVSMHPDEVSEKTEYEFYDLGDDFNDKIDALRDTILNTIDSTILAKLNLIYLIEEFFNNDEIKLKEYFDNYILTTLKSVAKESQEGFSGRVYTKKFLNEMYDTFNTKILIAALVLSVANRLETLYDSYLEINSSKNKEEIFKAKYSELHSVVYNDYLLLSHRNDNNKAKALTKDVLEFIFLEDNQIQNIIHRRVLKILFNDYQEFLNTRDINRTKWDNELNNLIKNIYQNELKFVHQEHLSPIPLIESMLNAFLDNSSKHII